MDIQLHFSKSGPSSGMPLIFLHGNGEDSSYFVHQVEYFSKDFPVICVDTRGHGLSPRGCAPFTLSQFADDLHDFMDENGIERAILFGFSDGANIAMIFALRYPECVEKLVLNSGNITPSGLKFWVRAEIFAEYLKARVSKNLHEIELMQLMRKEPHISADELNKISAPSLVLVGSRDMIKESHSRLIANSIPGAEFIIVEGTHFAAAENPDEVNRVVGEFLRGKK